MKMLCSLFLALLIVAGSATAQINLVMNPGFEDHSCCPFQQNMLYCSNHWYNPCNWNPDYFHTCGWSSFDPPYAIGGFQFPRTGDAYVGLSTYRWTENFREYAAQQLHEPLIADHWYSMGYYLSFLEVSFAMDLMGAAIVADTFVCDHVTTPLVSLLPFTPQVCNPAGNILMDTMNWVMIADTFKAVGGERFLVIGNFYSDSINTIYPFNWPWTNKIAYYLIDDVFLYDLGTFQGTEPEENDIADQFSLYPQPALSTLYIYHHQRSLEGETAFTIWDLQGRLIINGKTGFASGRAAIDISSLRAGLFFLNIVNGSKVSRLKFIRI